MVVLQEIGAVAQCPNNWGVGSAFHPMKIHILILFTPPDIYSVILFTPANIYDLILFTPSDIYSVILFTPANIYIFFNNIHISEYL